MASSHLTRLTLFIKTRAHCRDTRLHYNKNVIWKFFAIFSMREKRESLDELFSSSLVPFFRIGFFVSHAHKHKKNENEMEKENANRQKNTFAHR